MTPLDIEINNTEILEHLNKLKDEFFELKDSVGLTLQSNRGPQEFSRDPRSKTDPEYFLSEQYLREVIDKGSDHVGPPEQYRAFPIAQMAKADDRWSEYRDKVKNDLARMFGATHSALASFYPPGGFVGWHTNWNCSTYQILFTWSETGDSYFEYVDPISNEIMRINERPGWQAHYVYFGSQAEPENIFWHAAYTNCQRFAWALSWKNHSTYGTEKDLKVRNLVEMVVDELET